ncbi:MAG: hypothetical protein WBG30_14015, partial [Psychrilyobacter sp.]|uniref:esterase/lipase family protein n=1 Tax=Psychrilyobacter sp. TaxID=2586924 RepID=UPI003C75BA35
PTETAKNPNKGRPLPDVPAGAAKDKKVTDNNNDGIYNKLNEINGKETDKTYDKAPTKKQTGGDENNYFLVEKETDKTYDKTPTKKQTGGDENNYFVLEKNKQENPYETLDKTNKNRDHVYDKLENIKTPTKKQKGGDKDNYFVLEKDSDTPTKKQTGEDKIYDKIDDSKIKPDNIYDKIGNIGPNKGRPLPETPAEKRAREEAGYELAKNTPLEEKKNPNKGRPLPEVPLEGNKKIKKDKISGIEKVRQRERPEKNVKKLDLTNYNKAKDGIVGEDGHTYSLSPKKEGKILENIEKSYKKSKSKYLSEPTDANLKEFKKKEKAFEDTLNKYNKKIDLILKQKNIKQENVLDKATDPNDKYGGKVVTIKKEDIGVVKPTKKAVKQKLTNEQKKEYSKGKLGQYFKGKPDILDPKMRPENIGEVKDNTVNILIHGTFSSKSAENDWASPKSPHAKSINKEYGGEAVTFKWSGKNTADTRKKAGKELAKIIEGYNKKGIKVNIIAHSHGGNVANEALKLTNGKIDNLVTLGTPVRSDHKADKKTIESKTNSYLNVMSNQDTVTKQGGFDTKTDITKYIGGDNAFKRAHRKDKDADKILKIDGASHSELHSLAVIKQLKPLIKRNSKEETEIDLTKNLQKKVSQEEAETNK